eukprot:5527145-Prymnesium_polylepis.5
MTVCAREDVGDAQLDRIASDERQHRRRNTLRRRSPAVDGAKAKGCSDCAEPQVHSAKTQHFGDPTHQVLTPATRERLQDGGQRHRMRSRHEHKLGYLTSKPQIQQANCEVQKQHGESKKDEEDVKAVGGLTEPKLGAHLGIEVARFDEQHAEIYGDEDLLNQGDEHCIFWSAQGRGKAATLNGRHSVFGGSSHTNLFSGFKDKRIARNAMVTRSARSTRACSNCSLMSNTHPAV